MLFNSYIFIFAFFPIVFLGYWGLRKANVHNGALALLVVASLIFYSYQDVKFGILLFVSVLVNYVLHTILVLKRKNVYASKLILLIGCVYNLGILFYFKYLNFFLTNVSLVTGRNTVWHDVVLPLGISFYTFQQLSVIIDSYNGKCERYALLEYALYVCFFPQLIAGPIVLHGEMIPQFRDHKDNTPRLDNLYDGAQYFILGLCKKLVIADTLGRGVDWGYSNILYLNSLSAIVLILLYTLQIYFDFSGYCDMAIGLGRAFGFDIITNFNSPYKALSVSEFWKRWHITLTRFFTTYVYIPLGGNRKSKLRTYINVFIVFAISGLWHGASWTFVAWGIMHGIMMIVERLIGSDGLERLPKPVRFIYTFGFVNCAWVFFRANTFTDALNIFKRILHGGSGYILPEMQKAMIDITFFDKLGLSMLNRLTYMDGSEVSTALAVVVGLFVLVALYLSVFHINVAEIVKKQNIKTVYSVSVGILFVVALLSISGVSTFLYFNF